MVATLAPVPVVSSAGASIAFNSGTASASSTLLTGDYVLFLVNYDSTGAGDPTVSSSQGMGTITQLGTTIHYGTQRHAAMFGGFVTNIGGGLDCRVDFAIPVTSGAIVVVTCAYRGVDQTTPIDATTTQTSNAAAASHPSASITPVTNGARVVIGFGGSNDNGSAASPFTAPGAPWNVDGTAGTTLGNDCGASLFGQILAVAAITSLTVASTPSVASAVFSVALRPASSDPINEVYIGRSNTAQVGLTSGGFSRTTTDPNQVTIRQTPSSTLDTAVCVLWINNTGVSLLAAPGAPWVPFVELDVGSSVFQVYTAPWSGGLTWPTFTTLATTSRFSLFGMILRNIDPTNPFSASATGSGTTFASVTPLGDDATIVDLAFIYNDTDFISANSAGRIFAIPNIANSYATASGSDHGVLGVINKLVGGGATPTGTRTFTPSGGSPSENYTIAFAKAPNLIQLVSSVDPDIAVSTTLQIESAGIFIDSDVELDLGVSTTLISRQHRRNTARRAFLWHSGPDGDRTGVVS